MDLTKRQNEIIDAALRLTSKEGIQHLTIKNLSEAIGITEPAIYRHFKNKSEIVKAMIGRFESDVSSEDIHGLDGIRTFIMGRFAQVNRTPELARVMFSEELFMDDPAFAELIFDMMHKHKTALGKALKEAQANGEIRAGIETDMLFRILLGPVRLLVKQWGMTNGAFDLNKKGSELLETIFALIRPEKP